MTTIRELINRIDASDKNKTSVDFCELADELDVDCGAGWYTEFDTRVTAYWLYSWECTDTTVGLAFIFFDCKFIGAMSQSARKANVEFQFTCQADVDRLVDFMRELTYQKNRVSFLDLDEDLGETYWVVYGSQQPKKNGWYKGQPVTLVKTYGHGDAISNWERVVISYDESGRCENVLLRDVDLPFNLVSID